ncbi:MAG: thiamine diphosphokinase [Armatimonadota bacterium]
MQNLPTSFPPARTLAVLAGADLALDSLRAWVDSATRTLAADGAVSRLRAAGADADVVIGDLDSASAEDLDRTRARIVHVAEQETTDAAKLLRYVREEGHTSLTIIGLEGDRLDHLIATLHLISGPAGEGITISLGLRGLWGRLLRTGDEVRVDLVPGRSVSLLPLGDGAKGVTLEGVCWPVRPNELGNHFHGRGNYSISNEASGGSVRARVETGTALLLVGTEGQPLWL